jgi:galactonate dehydratase
MLERPIMKITEIQTHVCHAYRTNWVFVKVLTDNGLHGWGESTLEYRELAVCAAIEHIARELVGRDAGAINAIAHDTYRDSYWRGGPVLMSALSGIEMALWDIKGKSQNVPVYELLGGKMRGVIPCYANGWFAPAKTPEEFAAKALATVEEGYRALKWDPFGSAYRSIEPSGLNAAIACIEAVADAVGDRATLLIEGHGRFDLPGATRIAHALESYPITWFEEPLPPDSLDALAELRRRTRTPLAAGERLYNRSDFCRLFELGCVDYAQPDVTHVGGILELRYIAAMAEAHRVALCPHNPSGPVANAATLQLAAICPNFEYLEFMSCDVPWRSEVCNESLELIDGQIKISDRPGLGVEINEAAVAEHPFEPTRLRHFRGDLTDIRPGDATTTVK